MFTGIIEEIGTIDRITRGSQSAQLRVNCEIVTEGTAVGDSIAVNGVCLTVTSLSGDGFEADVMDETVRRTSLASLKSGSRVNLERAMPADGRFGGHIVAGHVDGTGRIRAIRKEEMAVIYEIEAAGLLRYIVEKGSVALDGISLTVASVSDTAFTVSIIPHTIAQTTLSGKQTGDIINIETDIIGKYVEKLLMGDKKEPGPLSGSFDEAREFLMKNGF